MYLHLKPYIVPEAPAKCSFSCAQALITWSSITNGILLALLPNPHSLDTGILTLNFKRVLPIQVVDIYQYLESLFLLALCSNARGIISELTLSRVSSMRPPLFLSQQMWSALLWNVQCLFQTLISNLFLVWSSAKCVFDDCVFLALVGHTGLQIHPSNLSYV